MPGEPVGAGRVLVAGLDGRLELIRGHRHVGVTGLPVGADGGIGKVGDALRTHALGELFQLRQQSL